jgi:hypothetical protein
VGYLSAQGTRVCEFACAPDCGAASLAAALLYKTGAHDAQAVLPLHALSQYRSLLDAADGWHIGPSCMVRVLDWQGFLTAMLRFAARKRGLIAGETVLGIAGEGNFRLAVESREADVAKTESAASLTLSGRDAVALLTLATGSAAWPGHPMRNWLPLPFFIPEPDSF